MNEGMCLSGSRLVTALLFQLRGQLLSVLGPPLPPLLIHPQVPGPLHLVLAVTKLILRAWVLPAGKKHSNTWYVKYMIYTVHGMYKTW